MATTQTPVETAPPESPAGLTHKQILTIIVGLMAGMFLAALDQTIVSTAIRTIGDDLHGLSIQAWVTTAYLITSTITTPLYGKLSDIYGRRPLFLTAISSSSSGRCLRVRHLDVPAGGVPRLPGHRRRRSVLAGAGDHRRHRPAAGARQVPGLLPGGVRHLERARPGGRRLLRRRSTILGITGWRWVFLINVPIGIVACSSSRGPAHPALRRDHRIDWWGAAALIVGTRAVADRRRAGPRLGLGLSRILGLLRRRPGRHHRLSCSSSGGWATMR